jgi:hypothetical protein
LTDKATERAQYLDVAMNYHGLPRKDDHERTDGSHSFNHLFKEAREQPGGKACPATSIAATASEPSPPSNPQVSLTRCGSFDQLRYMAA